MASLVLTLDIGTSSLRALLYDEQGASLPHSEVQIPHQVRVTPDGGAELDPSTLFDDTVRAIDGAIKEVPAGDELVGVAISSLWHSTLGVDEQGQAITPLYIWADTRASGAADELRHRLDERAVHARTGCVLHPSYLPARLLWLSQAQPDPWKRAAQWLSFGEYLQRRFLGRPTCSVSMASGTGLLDVHRCDWDPEILRAISLDPARLAPLIDLDKAAAPHGLQGEWASRWPSLADAPWFPAVGDGACGNVGSGCCTPDRIALNIGTSGAARVVLGQTDREVVPGLWFYRLDRRRPLLGGALSEGGNVFAWLRQTLQLDTIADLEAEVAAMAPDAHGLTMLPFLAGERSPDWNASARGTITGLTLGTKPAELVRASLEAISYRFALILRRLGPVAAADAPVVCSGGALLGSPAWLQIMADVLDRRVIASTEHEASSRGAALLALESLGLLADIAAAPADLGVVYEPDPQRHARYGEAIERQAHLYAQVLGPPRAI